MGKAAALLFLALLLPRPAAAGEGLPEFRLDRLKARGAWSSCPDFYIPPVSPPQRVSGIFPGRLSDFSPPPELYPLYRPYRSGFVPMGPGLMRTRTGSGGPGGTDNIRLTGAVKVSLGVRGGSAEVSFPRAEFLDPLPGDEARFYVQVSSEARPAELSWALVFCAGDAYLGYKGATLALAEGGRFSAADSLALGAGREALAVTHPWLSARLGGRGLDYLCSEVFPARNADLSPRALPRAAGGAEFSYDRAKNALRVSWKDK